MDKQELREDGRENTGTKYADLEIRKKETKMRLIQVLSTTECKVYLESDRDKKNI